MPINKRRSLARGKSRRLASMALAAGVCLEMTSGCNTTSNLPMSEANVQVHSQIELTFLRPGYHLYRTLTGAAGQPIIYWLKPAVLDDKGRIASMPRRLVDISAFVSQIRSPQEALAFARVYTRYPDFLMFDDKLLEIQDGVDYVRLPQRVKNDLLPLAVSPGENGGYGIARNLVRLDEANRVLSVFRSMESVGRTGEYQLRVERIYPISSGDLIIHLPE